MGGLWCGFMGWLSGCDWDGLGWGGDGIRAGGGVGEGLGRWL